MVNAATGGSPPQAESIRAALEIKAPRKTCENFDLNDIFFFLLKRKLFTYFVTELFQDFFWHQCVNRDSFCATNKKKPANNQVAGFLFILEVSNFH
jgi:hypothetical protein